MPDSDPIIARLEDQIAWYHRKSMSALNESSSASKSEIVAAALIPFLAALGPKEIAWSAWLTGGFGVVITVFEGLLQLGQYQQNWITYRSTCESPKHEKYLYLGKAGLYAGAPDSHALLAERVESLVSQEHAKWASAQQAQPKIKEA